MKAKPPVIPPHWPFEDREVIAVLYRCFRDRQRERNRDAQIAAKRALNAALAAATSIYGAEP